MMEQKQQNQRDNTVDLLKGFAILLMVMGHFYSQSVAHIQPDVTHNGWLVGQWIYSFHMPLFFFLTGYLSVKAPQSWADLGQKVLKKTQTLLLPGLSFMLMGYWLKGGWAMPWFLKVLFQLTVVFSVIRYLTEKWKLSLGWELLIHASVFALWFVGSHMIKGSWAAEHLWIHNAAVRYPYIVLGYVFAKQDWNRVLQGRNWLLTGTIVLYMASFYLSNWVLGGSVASYMRSYIVAPAAIIAVFTIGKRVSQVSKISRLLCYLGQKTLAIYLISAYTLVTFPQLIDWCILQDDVTSIVVQIVVGLVAATVSIALCLAMEWIINKSKILNLLLLGKK